MLPKWTDFTEVTERLTPEQVETRVRQLALETNSSDEVIRDSLLRNQAARTYRNSRYYVTVYRDAEGEGPEGVIHLSIKRVDQQPLGSERYRDFMLIKDIFMGETYEAVELYPSREREADSSTQYHLWGFDDPTFMFPFGYGSGRFVKTPEEAGALGSGARQNPFESHHKR